MLKKAQVTHFSKDGEVAYFVAANGRRVAFRQHDTSDRTLPKKGGFLLYELHACGSKPKRVITVSEEPPATPPEGNAGSFRDRRHPSGRPQPDWLFG